MHFHAVVDGTAGQLDNDLGHLLIWNSLQAKRQRALTATLSTLETCNEHNKAIQWWVERGGYLELLQGNIVAALFGHG